MSSCTYAPYIPPGYTPTWINLRFITPDKNMCLFQSRLAQIVFVSRSCKFFPPPLSYQITLSVYFIITNETLGASTYYVNNLFFFFNPQWPPELFATYCTSISDDGKVKETTQELSAFPFFSLTKCQQSGPKWINSRKCFQWRNSEKHSSKLPQPHHLQGI